MASMATVMRWAAAKIRSAPFSLTAPLSRTAPLSCGFSRKAAAAISWGYRYSTRKEDDVWECLREYGLNPDPSGRIVGKFDNPTLLLKKLEVLTEIGLSKTECCNLVRAKPRFFLHSGADNIKANGQSVFALHDSKSDALSYIRDNPQVLFSGRVSVGIAILEAAGMKDCHILTFLKKKTRSCTSPNLQQKVNEVIGLGGINPKGNLFGRILQGIISGKEKTIREKQLNYEKFGVDKKTFWTVATMKNAGVLTQSVENIKSRMSFFKQQCGLEPTAVARYPKLLTQKDLEDLKLRFYVYTQLKNKGLVKEVKKTKRNPQRSKLLILFNHTKEKFEEWMNGTAGKGEAERILKEYQKKSSHE